MVLYLQSNCLIFPYGIKIFEEKRGKQLFLFLKYFCKHRTLNFKIHYVLYFLYFNYSVIPASVSIAFSMHCTPRRALEWWCCWDQPALKWQRAWLKLYPIGISYRSVYNRFIMNIITEVILWWYIEILR